MQLIASKAVSGAGIYGFGELYSITSVQGFVRASETFTNVDGLESGLCSIQGMHLFCVEIGCKEAVNAAGGHKSNLGLVPVSVTPQAPPPSNQMGGIGRLRKNVPYYSCGPGCAYSATL